MFHGKHSFYQSQIKITQKASRYIHAHARDRLPVGGIPLSTALNSRRHRNKKDHPIWVVNYYSLIRCGAIAFTTPTRNIVITALSNVGSAFPMLIIVEMNPIKLVIITIPANLIPTFLERNISPTEPTPPAILISAIAELFMNSSGSRVALMNPMNITINIATEVAKIDFFIINF